jgi:tetratricopeptide (TPR) repeat protein
VVRNLNQSISDLDSLAIKAQHPLFIPFVLSNRSLILFVEGDLPNALAKSQEAVDCSPNSPSILTIYAKHLLSNGRSEEALVNLDRALSLNPFEREAYYFRHEVHEAMGNKELAEADKKIALDYGYRPYL